MQVLEYSDFDVLTNPVQTTAIQVPSTIRIANPQFHRKGAMVEDKKTDQSNKLQITILFRQPIRDLSF